jgi:hypothetical protein
MKKVFIVVLFIITSYFILSIAFHQTQENPITTYRFDFDDIDREFWLVGGWESLERDYDLVSLNDGILTLSADTSGINPYLLSKPLEIKDGDVITMKRRVRIQHGPGTFSGGTALYQTDDMDLIPSPTDGRWTGGFGDGILLVEYSYDLIYQQDRPGRDVFRFLAADWDYNDNYQLITPVYDTWVEETIIFDTRSSQMTYILGDKSYVLSSYNLDRSALRFWMHAYGTGTGNKIDIDYIEITIENKKYRR